MENHHFRDHSAKERVFFMELIAFSPVILYTYIRKKQLVQRGHSL